MIANIEHANGKMTVTTVRGETATRKTYVPYQAAIIGRRKRDGKLVVIFASNSERDARAIFGSLPHAPVGSRLQCRYSGFSEIELVTPDAGWTPAEDPDAWKTADAALIAARRAA
mgnify:CR=1 FL=1